MCDYCAKLGAVENSEMLALDALEFGAPTLYIVLTTRQAITDPAPFYAARRKVFKALKRRWPDAEYAALVEFTTGKGHASGGQRRPHWNLLVKGVPVADEDRVRELVRRVWCEHPDVDARPEAQWVSPVAEVGGLMRYLALHFQKQSQSPPEGWRGHRFTASRGYLGRPTPEARELAKRSLRSKREVWKAQKEGHRGLKAERLAQARLALADSKSWTLIQVSPENVEGCRRAYRRSDGALLFDHQSGRTDGHVSRASADPPADHSVTGPTTAAHCSRS